mmetsp:Transcript_4559/g.11008  ORF Transcript_4559/g.11008 Transcript_4559/m.11008 type:complete len:201 (+) Transcript_4559:92-694(+)
MRQLAAEEHFVVVVTLWIHIFQPYLLLQLAYHLQLQHLPPEKVSRRLQEDLSRGQRETVVYDWARVVGRCVAQAGERCPPVEVQLLSSERQRGRFSRPSLAQFAHQACVPMRLGALRRPPVQVAPPGFAQHLTSSLLASSSCLRREPAQRPPSCWTSNRGFVADLGHESKHQQPGSSPHRSAIDSRLSPRYQVPAASCCH